ncbi:MAG TPA: flagellar basal body P-ring formation chaperone FlgA [Rhizomicrobium sp.]
MKKILLALLLFAAPALADTGVRIVVPAHDIARGQTISESDLAYETIATSNFMSGMVTSMNALSGMETRRTLRTGESVRDDDVRHPILVIKGQTVTMVFDAPGITLTAVGRSMSEGGMGETVTVQNPASFRMVTATVTGAGAVRTAGSFSAAPAQASRASNQTASN